MPAAALYQSPLFRKSLMAALDTSDKVFILSAKHGVISCNEFIEPYDITLKTMRRSAREAWGLSVLPRLREVLRARDTAVMFCGEEYLAPLRGHFEQLKVTIEMPLGSLSLGSRLRQLAIMNEETQLRQTGAQFAQLMRKLWMAQDGGRRIADTNGHLPWPSRGVYFILEPDRGMARGRMPRVVRVGTHAVSQGSRTSLWNRLSTHRGTAGGSGSHRSSIFRLHVGRAWARSSPSNSWPDTWAQGQSAPREIRDAEQELERDVSQLIGAMRVIWLDVPDEAGPTSERAYLERNSIGLLSRIGLLDTHGATEWLGRSSADWRIATSGLWNLNYVFAQPDGVFIDRLTAAVARTIGRDLNVVSDKISPTTENQLDFMGEMRGGNDA